MALDPLNSPGCLSTRRERLFGEIKFKLIIWCSIMLSGHWICQLMEHSRERVETTSRALWIIQREARGQWGSVVLWIGGRWHFILTVRSFTSHAFITSRSPALFLSSGFSLALPLPLICHPASLASFSPFNLYFSIGFIILFVWCITSGPSTRNQGLHALRSADSPFKLHFALLAISFWSQIYYHIPLHSSTCLNKDVTIFLMKL